ncbi:MAG: ABC-type lipoprotein export system ATPase subunit [Sediminicola sp.]
MVINNPQKGSQWQRWDLHLHTPFTKLANAYKGKDEFGTWDEEKIWDEYIKILHESPVQAFGITDYFSCDNYFKLIEKYNNKYPDSAKVFFPNIELRYSEAISRKETNPDVHIIFDNDQKICSQKQINKFLSNLPVLGSNHNDADVCCTDLESEREFESSSITIKCLKDALIKTFGTSKPYLIVFPANNDGVRSTDSQSPRKVKASDTMDELADLFFGNSKNKPWFLRNDRYEDKKSEPKPVVSFSDAHSFAELERLEGVVANYEPTWIKADLTFRGLKQICFEPDARVFIGEEPPVNTRKLEQSTKFISQLNINQITKYDKKNGDWFQNVEIPINPELTAIIGNKGSGKSALIDIIGLLGESRQEAHFSFLSNKSKNKKFKQVGYAENFSGELIWLNSASTKKLLSDNVDKTKPEAVRYLPQNYFEELTNDIEIIAFRREIENVVFSHVDETNRLGCSSFEDLQTLKTQQNIQETSFFKTNLREINVEILRLENEFEPTYKKSLNEELLVKKAELKATDVNKPQEELKPDSETQEQQKLSQKMEALSELLEQIKGKGKSVRIEVTNKKNKLQKVITLQQSLLSVEKKFIEQKRDLESVCIELGVDIEDIVKLEIGSKTIEDMRVNLCSEILLIEKDNELELSMKFDFSGLTSIPDLLAAHKYISEQINELKNKLGTPQRKYQTYLDKLSKWKSQRKYIIGEDESPKAGTIKFLEDKLLFIDTELSEKLLISKDKRKELSRNIFESKNQVLNFYSELKKSVETKLDSIRTESFYVNIDSSFILEQSFYKQFTDYISKNKRGSFAGIDGANKLLKELINKVNWNDFESIYSFLENVLTKLNTHEGKDNPIAEQIIQIKDFYDFIFSFSYFLPKYELRLGDKNLNELSPGEKGLLLLVFYLQLDKNNTPLVIDQPEDNLDNESIFTVLANCIREAKKHRQVILVTHNPNLAVGADAEQIVYVQLNKSDNYKFTYESGSIENPRINEKIVVVLEGTQPAFVKRRLKYEI